MRTGAEIKVGVVTLLAAALLALFAVYISGVRLGAHTYTIYVLFDNARGLQAGDPVRMVGKKIGQVREVQITPAPRKAQVALEIDRTYPLYKNYVFQLVSAGLIQERSIEVMPTRAGEEGPQLADQAKVQGVAATDLADILTAGQQVLLNLNRTSELLQTVLSNQEILPGVKRALDSFRAAADAAAEATTTAAGLVEESRPEAAAILAQLKAAAGVLQSTAEAIHTAVAEGGTLADLQETAHRAREVSAKAEQLTDSLAEIISDPQTKAELRDTLANIHKASISMKKIGEDLEVFSGQVREVAPSVPKVARRAEELSGLATDLRERLKPPEIHGDFSVVYGGNAHRSFSTGSLDFSTSPDRFLRLGIDDIGEQSSVNIQLGEPHWLGRQAVLRYGLVRSRLGLGLDFGRPHRSSLSIDLFDPNRLRADVMADVPLILGTTDWGLRVGVRNAGGENTFVLGARVRR